jgi:hypothetical protein
MCGVVKEIFQEGALLREQEMYAELLEMGKTVEEIAAFYGKTVDEIKYVLQLEL